MLVEHVPGAAYAFLQFDGFRGSAFPCGFITLSFFPSLSSLNKTIQPLSEIQFETIILE